MSSRIALFGGSFNPPGLHHRAIAEALIHHFDRVVVVPSGPRPDKPAASDVETIHRAAMADLAFRGLTRLRVDLFDLEQASFTRTHELENRYLSEGEIWLVVGTDLIGPGLTGQSFIREQWERGEELWQRSRFAVFHRQGYPVEESALPPRHQLFTDPVAGNSRAIRLKAFRHESIDHLVSPEVAAYIERYGLYRGRPPARTAPLLLQTPRPHFFVDDRNPQAREMAAKFRGRFEEGPENCVLVIGGDGAMLHAIRQHWRMRLPFIGINAGHRGFLLNGAGPFQEKNWPELPLLVRQAPLLYVEVLPPGGRTWKSTLAFNDAWVERHSSQTAWIEVSLDGQPRIPCLLGDGVLLATAAGSTAYARAMGATPVLFGTPALILVGSNVMEPLHWKSVMLALDSVVEFRSLDPVKRPLQGFSDGIPLGDVMQMRIRTSRIASAELAFLQGHDLAEKIAEIQFPPLPSQPSSP